MLSLPLALALLAVGPDQTPSAVEWQIRVDQTAEVFKTQAIGFGKAGYRPAAVTMYNRVEENRFGAIWEKLAGPEWQVDFGLDRPAFERQVARRRLAGFRPVSLAGGNQVGRERLTGLWQKADGSAWELLYGKTGEDFQEACDDLEGHGYRPLSVSVYNAEGETRYASVWEKRGGPQWKLKFGLSGKQLQDALDDLTGQGYRPTSLSGVRGGVVEFFTGTWERRGGGPWQAFYGQSVDDLQTTSTTYRGRGYRPVWISGYNTVRGDRFCSIWEK